MDFKLAFAGFGVVGQGLCEILQEKETILREKYGMNWKVVVLSSLEKSLAVMSVQNTEYGLSLPI